MNSGMEKDEKKEMIDGICEEEKKNNEMMIEESMNDDRTPEAITDEINDSGPDETASNENGKSGMENFDIPDESAEESTVSQADNFDSESINEDEIDEGNISESFVDKVRNTELGKKILGEDGKFDHEDIERIAESAKSAVKGAADLFKGLFGE